MRRFPTPLLFAVLAILPQAATAQETPLPGRPIAAMQGSSGRAAGSRNQIAVEIGIVSGGLSYARRVGATSLSVGAGVWGAWEPPNSFDRNVWEPLGVTVFSRYRAASWLHTDVGIAAARYVWADDCSACSGTFVGVRSAVLAGHRFLFAGPELLVGRARDDNHGSEFGVIWGAQVRLILGWDG